MREPQLVGALDLGGSKLAYGVFGEGSAPLLQARVATHEVGGPGLALATVALGLKAMAQAQGRSLSAIGIASAGPLDVESGRLLNPPNLPQWEGADLCGPLTRALGIPAALVNDADAAALAEAQWGAGVGASSMLYITWSTGVGGGLVIEGHSHRGWRALAGELGHICVVPHGRLCGCGKRGCLEAELSGHALSLQVQALAQQGELDGLALLASGSALHAGHLFMAAEAGLASAVRLRDEAIAVMARGISAAIHLLAPECVVMGGGVMAQGQDLLLSLREALAPEVAYLGWPVAHLKQAKFTAEAPLLGAALVAKQLLLQKQP